MGMGVLGWGCWGARDGDPGTEGMVPVPRSPAPGGRWSVPFSPGRGLSGSAPGSACLEFRALSSGIAKEHQIPAVLRSLVLEAAEPVPAEQAASLSRLVQIASEDCNKHD